MQDLKVIGTTCKPRRYSDTLLPILDFQEYSIRNMSDPRDSEDEDHSYHPHHHHEEYSEDDEHGAPLVRFPTAMSYHSDAQRSDAATVGSILEDIEVESVLSLPEEGAPQHSLSPAQASSDNTLVQPSGTDFSERLSSTALIRTNMGNMDPPLDRTFLLHHALVSSSEPADPRHVGFPTTSPEVYSGHKPPAPSSVKSYGSNVGSDDCGNSLDVETHSVGTRSIHSQDGLEPAAETEAAVASLTIDPEPGRRSPGGTLYKGRGIRRYQGRYMHLPLQRFHHQNREDRLAAAEEEMGGVVEGWNDPRRRDEDDRAHRPAPPRPRSRSRSRSPPPMEEHH